MGWSPGLTHDVGSKTISLQFVVESRCLSQGAPGRHIQSRCCLSKTMIKTINN